MTTEPEIRDHLDHRDPGPQAVRRGRLHRLEVQVYVQCDATAGQIEEAIAHELGSGGIGEDNPLYKGGFEVREVLHREDTGLNGFTLWDAVGEHEPGRRVGHIVHRPEGEPLGFEVVAPAGNGDGGDRR